MKFNFKLEEIKYAKVSYRDKNNEPVTKKIAVKTLTEREILACTRFESGLDINTPQEVVLSFVCNDGIYKTKTILKAVDNDEPYIFFIFQTPEGIEYEQNREYFRVLASFNCIYKIKENDEIREFETNTVDISASGVSIVLPFSTITEDFSDIVMAINGKLVRARIHFIRSEKFADGYRHSFAYTKISEEDRDYISQVCLQKQLEERRNSIR